MTGKQIKLFLVDGSPGSLTTAEITYWTGHVRSAPRSELADLLKRDKAQRTGAYLLLGEDEEAVGNTRCYIGGPKLWPSDSAINSGIGTFGTASWWSRRRMRP